MVAFTPFQVITASASGKTVLIQTSAGGSSVAGTLDSTGGYAPSVLVINRGANDVWIRMSSEATPTATQNDIPMFGNTVRLFANPMPTGKLGIAVLISVSTSQVVSFVPGTAGI